MTEALEEFEILGLGSAIGANNAWRGFMLQALYIGELIARGEDDAVYMPETVEDLAIGTL